MSLPRAVVHFCTGVLLYTGLMLGTADARSTVNDTYRVQKRPIINTVILGGTVIPAKEVTLSAQLPGRINIIAGEEGDYFEEETLLVALDDTELLAQRRAAWAQVMNAYAVARNANVQFRGKVYDPDTSVKEGRGMGLPLMFDQMFTEEAEDMLGTGDSDLVRERELYQYSAQRDQAMTAVWAAQAQLDTIDAKLRDARGIAPFNGVITRKMVEEGDTVQPGMPLLQFTDTTHLQIQVEVSARLIPGLHMGRQMNMPVDARLDVGGWGKVTIAQIFPSADRNRHTVTVKFDLPAGVQTWPGQYAQVRLWDLSVRNEPQIVIPRSALIQRGSLPSVYVIHDDRRELRMVRTGESNGSEVIILSGLNEGEVIELEPPKHTDTDQDDD